MTTSAIQEFLGDFLLEAAESLDELEELLLDLERGALGERPELARRANRILHTLKGNSAMMGFSELQTLAHRMEDRLAVLDPLSPELADLLADVDRFRKRVRRIPSEAAGRVGAGAGAAASSEVADREVARTGVRVPFAALDELVDRLAEMMIFRNRLEATLGGALAAAATSPEARGALEPIAEAEQNLGKTLDSLRDGVMKLRLVPLRTLFTGLHRIVYEEGLSAGKQVRLEVSGGETPLDKALLEVASEAAGHLVRNAVVHGIEPPEERAAAGKPRAGRVSLSAAARGGEVYLEVADDGRGLDREGLLEAARRQGVELPAGAEPRLSELLFRAGVSTRGEVDLSAGRGVGLDAVHGAVERQGGRIEVSSEPGRGTRFALFLPLSVSITRALLVATGGERYALPMSSVIETLRLEPDDRHRADGAGVYRWRGRVLPLVDLGRRLAVGVPPAGRRFVLVVEAERKLRAVTADEVLGIQEIVVKGLDPVLGRLEGISGVTVLGDGGAVLILDPYELVTAAPDLEATA